ncbi:lanthionine synthetase C family protein [Actinocorallia sp. API 0066]|uniref:lanthionine synthetase C family protein n=1 Tax=Actinocorallia sp. API 0066 TaxID=2896846 RepID=UPI001E298443|nr:lanthionine synthetase C family protein [Actinocorallia sp. API 0066]MCD0449053.1 lanthionine synthetase C family protein [Actinocorallia sp. API 0066]
MTVSSQSLAHGAAGRALVEVERALNGTGGWGEAKAAVQEAARTVHASPDDCLYFGAPAVTFLLTCASADGRPRFAQAARALDGHVRAAARRKLTGFADGRVAFVDYDLFRGLVGLGALLLARAPDGDELGEILVRLVALTLPLDRDGRTMPGWWVDHDPDPLLPTPGGHANLGVAHGAAGILALLSLAARAGRSVPGQDAAIARLLEVYDRWQQDGPDGPWWPQWLTRDDLLGGRLAFAKGPGRPSWCYGAVGIARAVQLGAIATGDYARQEAAEAALAANLCDRQLDRLDGHGLCHGIAGVYQTAARAALDARTPALGSRLPALAARLPDPRDPTHTDDGLLTGSAGITLAVQTARRSAPPASNWDRCLLIT